MSDSRALGALEEREAWDPLGPPRSGLGWGWGAAHSLTQCVEVYTMAQLLGRADSSIWPLTPTSDPARTEGGPLGTPGPVPSRGDAQWSCDKTGFEEEVDWWKQDIFKLEKETEDCDSRCDSWVLRQPRIQRDWA